MEFSHDWIIIERRPCLCGYPLSISVLDDLPTTFQHLHVFRFISHELYAEFTSNIPDSFSYYASREEGESIPLVSAYELQQSLDVLSSPSAMSSAVSM
jgi:hypothetical protein